MNKIKEAKNKKVIMAMSGGVDSSVAAALLRKEGFDIIGVFIKFWTAPEENGLVCAYNRCCSPESEKRARKVAEKLNIPFYVFNFEKEFKKKVVDYFLKEYKAGLTPNPCVVCNKEIKFGLLFKKLLSLNADYIATGHYVKKQETRNKKQIEYKLLKAKDKEKDQSYFLWQLDQKILEKTLFPAGDYAKSEIKKMAKKFKLPVVDIPESQEVCFIYTTTNDFLRRYLKSNPGKIINTKGKEIGRHQGLWFYTIGQRKGIELSQGPFYVLEKDIKKNLLIVTKNQKDLFKKELVAKNINWILGREPKLPLKVLAKIRYAHKSALAAVIKHKKDKIKIVFLRSQKAITPGQSVVFYKNQELLGGAVIK